MNAPFLHVANGSCTTAIIQAAALPGDAAIWADPLYDGPVPGGVSDDELLVVRAEFLASAAHPAAAVAETLRGWRRVIESGTYDELVLWFEHDLFDQLNLIQLLSWAHGRLGARTVSGICIDAFPGHPDFKGLGELSPKELASLMDRRVAVTDDQYELADRAWQAFRAPTPEPLDALRRGDTSALPFLAASLTRWLQEYPWTTDGLSRSERRLLALADERPIDLRHAFPRMHDGEVAYYITDGSLDAMATLLAQLTPALLARSKRETADQLLDGSIATTAAGRDVLAGRADRVTTCGIDRWCGGTHLQGHAAMWRWDDAKQRLALD